MRLKDKVAVVTGAGSGMGFAIAQRFVAEGAKVVAADWHGETVKAAAVEIGGSIVAVTADVSSETDAVMMVDRAVSEFGGIDILVNNAGVMDLFQSVADVSNETWRRVMVVTGAGSGMGFAIAQRFVAEGAKVVAADWHGETVKAAAGEIGGSIVAVTADVSSETDAVMMVDRAVSEFGGIDILVNNAGVMDLFQSVADVSNETWRRVMGVNVDGPLFAMRRAVPLMLARGGGSIVNIASVAGVGGGSAGAAYTASKHALIGLTRSTAYQYAKTNLRCNAVVSGGVATNIMASIDQSKIDQEALARLGPYHAANPGMLESADIANLVLFLASDEARYINGVAIPADRGWRAA